MLSVAEFVTVFVYNVDNIVLAWITASYRIIGHYVGFLFARQVAQIWHIRVNNLECSFVVCLATVPHTVLPNLEDRNPDTVSQDAVIKDIILVRTLE